MKERRAPRCLDGRAELFRDQRGQSGALDQVVEDVLAVTGAEPELAEQLGRDGSSALTRASSAAFSPSSTMRLAISSRTCS